MNENLKINIWNDGWVSYKRSFKRFMGDGLNLPGTRIITEDGKMYIIGNINTNGGVCDCCIEFSKDTIIEKYMPEYVQCTESLA